MHLLNSTFINIVLSVFGVFTCFRIYQFLQNDIQFGASHVQEITTASGKSKPYEVTVVTMYFPLNTFAKAWTENVNINEKYRFWMQTFGWLNNKLVAFISDDDTYNYFKKIRSHLPPERTVLYKVNRSDMNAFKDYDRVSKIFSSESYPKYSPNTVNANYSVIMNAKYDALQMAMDFGHVDTEYIAWLDIGCFRNLPENDIRPIHDSFTLQAPLDMDPAKIAFTEIGERDYYKALTPWDYIKDNSVWVSGSFCIAQTEVMKKFIKSYKRVVQSLLQNNMSSTDQQIIGAMYSPDFIEFQEVEIQPYRCEDQQFGLKSWDLWQFCLAYICKEAAELRKANSTLT